MTTYSAEIQLEGCIVLNKHNTVFVRKQLKY